MGCAGFRKKQGKQADLLKTNKLPWLLQALGIKKIMSAEKRLRLKGKDKQ